MARLSARVSSLGWLLVCAGALPVALGCAAGKSAEDRQLDELRDEIARVQSESDKVEERLGKLEVDSADVRTAGSAGSSAGASSGAGGAVSGRVRPEPARTLSTPLAIATPSLRVVHLGSDGSEQMGSADEVAGAVGAPEADDGPPIQIRATGNEAAIITDPGTKANGQGGQSGKGKRHEDPAPATANTTYFTNANLGPSLATHSGSRPSALDEEAKHSYDEALALVNGKHYPEALEALAGFLVRWPDHPNADNAMYWRGECYFAQGDFSDAASEFEGLLARFPLGNKAPDALLKLGMCEQRLDNVALARQRFDRLRREFPRSEAARHIPEGGSTVRAPAPGRSTAGDKP